LLARVRLIALLTLVTLPLSGCFFRSHHVTKSVFVGQLKQATLNELIQKVNTDAAKIKTLQLTVDIDTSVGGSKTGKVTEYKEIRGYVLLRKPGNLRMQGLLPVVHNRAFDMVSDGEQFRLSVPPKNRFVIGAQEVKNFSDKPFENLRPRQIYDTLIVDAIDTKNDVAVLEAGEVLVQDPHHREVSEPNYIMTIIHNGKDAPPFIERKIYFSREDLSVQKQVLFDREGNAATVGTYNNYSMESGVMLPHLITIDRPQEQYTLQLAVVKAQVNVAISNEQFQLPRPEGSELQIMDNVTPDQSILGPANPKSTKQLQH
jgi:outer membrane lipoprotein-sorting protein